MKLNIVGKKLLEWQPLLASLFEDDDIKVIDINSRKFEVYNSKESRLLYLKDVSDYVGISKSLKISRFVLRILRLITMKSRLNRLMNKQLLQFNQRHARSY